MSQHDMPEPLNINNVDELELLLERMTSDVRRMYIDGNSNAAEIRLLATQLTESQHALKNLERTEACRGIPSRPMAGRFVEMWSRIRAARTALDRGAPGSGA